MNKQSDSNGLDYKINIDGKTCEITGIGTCEDETVIIPEAIDGYTVTGIGADAFRDCHRFKNITIPQSIRSIGERTFCGCTQLSELIVPDSVIYIAECAFPGVGEVKISEDNPNYMSSNNAVFTKDMKTLLHCAANIKERFFDVPSSVTRIGNGAFHACQNLTSIHLGNSVTEIGENTFWACKNLEDIDLGNSVAIIGRSAFKACIKLQNVALPVSLATIEKNAFLFCNSLSSVRYNGTRLQWKQVRLEDAKWRYDSAIRTLVCVDGTIEYLF